jgi:lipopolysaccharide transport system permease protein
MATATPAGSTAPSVSAPPVTRIRPIGGWFDLNLKEFWAYRELIYFFVWRDLKVRYKQTFVGAAWAILQPTATMVLFTVFFGRFLGLPSGGLPDPVFYYASLLPWTYFAHAVTTATNTLIENQGVVTKVYFPRLIMPVAAVIPGLVDLLIASSVLIVIMLVYGITPAATSFMAPLFILLAACTALGVGLWLSVLNAAYRDIRIIIPFIIQAWFFVSPVIYPADSIPEAYRWIYSLNPMTGAIEGFRWSLTGVGDPPSGIVIISAVAVAVLLVSGAIFFRRREVVIADVI